WPLVFGRWQNRYELNFFWPRRLPQQRGDNGRVLANDQQPTTNDRPVARLHLPVWLRPPAKHQRQVFALQFLPLYIVIAVWLCFLSALLFILRVAGTLSYGSVALHGEHIWKLATFWAIFFLCVAVFEEFTFRGYTQFAIQQVAGFWPAALLLSAIFAYIHHSN